MCITLTFVVLSWLFIGAYLYKNLDCRWIIKAIYELTGFQFIIKTLKMKKKEREKSRVTVRQARDLSGWHELLSFCHKIFQDETDCLTFFCLFACLLLFVSHQLPEVRWQWNGSETDHSLFSKTMVRCGFLSPLRKEKNSNCSGWFSITGKINPRETSCSWDIDCSFSSGPASIWGVSAPSLKGKGMRWRSGVMQSHFLL